MRFDEELFNLLDAQKRANRLLPINLGGASGPDGGIGGPPGGMVGKLTQSRVAYDETEAVFTLPASGYSLVTNLNRIRSRIANLEVYSASGITVVDDSFMSYPGITTLNFIGTTITSSGAQVNITVSGGSGPSGGTDFLVVQVFS
jgi:hypothetical protein